MTTAVQFGDHHLTVMHRDDWGGGPVRRGYEEQHVQFRGLVIHHTVTIVRDWDGDGIIMGDLDDLARHQRYLQTVREADLGPEVPYSWTVAPHPDPKRATILEGRGWGRTGAHTAGLNSTRYGVAIIGNTSTTPITPGVVAAVRFLGGWLHDQPSVVATTGHRDHKATECPGGTMYAAMPEVQPPFNLTDSEEVDRMPDAPSDYAADAWAWALAEGITTGGNPQGNVSREMVLVFLHRYWEMFDKGELRPEWIVEQLKAASAGGDVAEITKQIDVLTAKVSRNEQRLDRGAAGLKG